MHEIWGLAASLENNTSRRWNEGSGLMEGEGPQRKNLTREGQLLEKYRIKNEVKRKRRRKKEH